jgi:4'-phosphopantetheinyl transferase
MCPVLVSAFHHNDFSAEHRLSSDGRHCAISDTFKVLIDWEEIAAGDRIEFRRGNWDELLTPALPANGVHLWAARLNREALSQSNGQADLSPAERDRAARFLLDRERRRFTASHVFLRRILAAYTGIAPRSLQFEHGPHGKPELAGPTMPLPVHFNLSHAGELAVVAVARQTVGVDIEVIREIQNYEQIAKRFFTAREYAAILAFPEPERSKAFLHCWTRKEAFVKAVGAGLSMPLNSFDHHDSAQWKLLHFEPLEGFTGAVAAPFAISTVVARFFPSED